ncbi:MAG: metalloregulator ArsR/SmtB family transcription factor [Gammaproteobacteria bacterium]|nr:metalloregulator ArsR/SmtB family transcription factor [Gammaproteobacteria bacterium]NND37693.1 metalloregulator ArsR/SmtB family transcription factor [Gammaproteobacteria bacterium]
MSLDTTVQTLKAAGDPTRARLLALLSGGEATVGELQRILGQSQPRVSRHLRLLDEAGLVTKFRDGQWTYYRLAADPVMREFVVKVMQLAGGDDATLANDSTALAAVKRERERDALTVLSGSAIPVGTFSTGRPEAAQLAEAIDELIADEELGDVLNVGSGAGNLLCQLGRRAQRIVGVDNSRRMRLLARSRAHQSGISNCTVRNGELGQLPFDDHSFDVVVLDEVLGAVTDRMIGLREANRVLRSGGRLIIADRLQPVARQLTTAGGAMIENQLTAELSELGYRVVTRTWLPGRALEYALLLAVREADLQRTGTHG